MCYFLIKTLCAVLLIVVILYTSSVHSTEIEADGKPNKHALLVGGGIEFEGLENRETIAMMRFPDGDLSYIEFGERLRKIKAKQIIVVLNQCFAGQFTDITKIVRNSVVISETREVEFAFNQTRDTLKWQYDVWPFVKCFFDGFLHNSSRVGKISVWHAFQYMLLCNPHIDGIPVQADRPLLKENPKIKYGSKLKEGTVFIY